MAVIHKSGHGKQTAFRTAAVLVCLFASVQPTSAQDSMNNYGQQVIPVTANGAQYQAGYAPSQMMPPSQPLTARTQLDQGMGNNSYQSPWTTVQQPQGQTEGKKKRKKGHPVLSRLGNAAGQVGSGALSAAGTAARVAAPMGMMMGTMYAMNRSYGSSYGYAPSYMYSYMPYMGYRMLSAF